MGEIRGGVGILVIREVGGVEEYLLGERRGSHGEGEFASPGGHIEFRESIVDCVRREIKEELGVEVVGGIEIRFFYNMVKYKNHYLHIGVVVRGLSGEPKLMEPEKCKGWKWYRRENLPAPLFDCCQRAFENLDHRYQFCDSDRRWQE